ncbi:MAG: RpiB/LacA/LacB family sugar-phosphate isomerase [Proteobacteria bacterium]|nr:RpiB/LacA/LacB family sugar-phosphate isomerase [Pseudomonadota bacterium]
MTNLAKKRIILGSDDKTALTDAAIEYLRANGFEIELYGALKADATANPEDNSWSKVAFDVARKVANQAYQQAILFCFTGTGVCMAANKVKGIRAALCNDAKTAKGARLWNDANILVMSLGSVEIWFASIFEEIFSDFSNNF